MQKHNCWDSNPEPPELTTAELYLLNIIIIIIYNTTSSHKVQNPFVTLTL